MYLLIFFVKCVNYVQMMLLMKLLEKKGGAGGGAGWNAAGDGVTNYSSLQNNP